MFRPKGARARLLHSQDGSSRSPEPDDSVRVTHGTFKTKDGTRLFYCSEGEGEPIVFLYGLVCSSLHWTYQLDHFRKRYRCIWFDYRAHHNSERPENLDTLNVETFAADLITLLRDELKLDRVVLMAHSMGVNVALETWRQDPGLVRGMGLVAGTARAPLETIFHVNITRSALKAMKRIHRLSPKLVSKFWDLQKDSLITHLIVKLGGFNPFLTPKEDVDLYVRQVMSFDPEIFIRVLENYDAFDAQSWLNSVDVPTLVMAGEKDYVIPLKQQENLAQLIPGSELDIIKNGSHCPQMDLPDIVNRAIERFLAKLGVQPSAPGLNTHSDQGKSQSAQASDESPFS